MYIKIDNTTCIQSENVMIKILENQKADSFRKCQSLEYEVKLLKILEQENMWE